MIAPLYGIVLLLPVGGGPALSGIPLRLGFPHKACILSPLLEDHVPHDLRPDLTGPADAQHLREDDVGKDEGSLRVPAPVENLLPFRFQDSREAAPHRSRGRGVLAR